MDFSLFFSNSFNDIFFLFADLKEKKKLTESSDVLRRKDHMFYFSYNWNKCPQNEKLFFFNEKSLWNFKGERLRFLCKYNTADLSILLPSIVIYCSDVYFYETLLLSNTLSGLHMMYTHWVVHVW